MLSKGVIAAFAILAALACATFVAPTNAPFASAASGGTIDARGAGIAELRGAIDATVTAHYPVMLTKDFGGDGTMDVPAATDRVSFLGFTVYFSAQSAHIAGSDVEIAVIGEQIHASGSGVGTAYFKGTGSYIADRQSSGSWDPDAGTAVAVGTAAASGQGLFVAHGRGVVAVRGTVTYRSGTPAGVLLVKDIAGNATIDVSGGVRGEFMGFTAYAGFNSATISGSDVGMVVAGVDLYVTATGTGLAYVLGDGAYSLNGATSDSWTIRGRFVDVGPR